MSRAGVNPQSAQHLPHSRKCLWRSFLLGGDFAKSRQRKEKKRVHWPCLGRGEGDGVGEGRGEWQSCPLLSKEMPLGGGR